MGSRRIGRLPDLPPGIYGVDIETTGGKKSNPFEHEIIAVGVSDGLNTWVIENIGVNDLLSLVPFLESEDHIKVAHNRDFDMGFLNHKLGAEVRKTYCTLIVERMLNNNAHPSHRVDCGLQAVLARRCGVVTDKEVRDEFEHWNGEPLTDEQFEYLINDTKYLPQIMQQQIGELNGNGMGPVGELETKLDRVFLKKYVKGVAFDLEAWEKAVEEVNAYCNKLYTDIRELLHERKQICQLCTKLNVLELDICPLCWGKGYHPYHYQDEPMHPEMSNKKEFKDRIKELWDDLATDEAKSIYRGLRSKNTWDEDKPYSIQGARILALKAIDITHPDLEYDIWANFDYWQQVLPIAEHLGAEMSALMYIDDDGEEKYTTGEDTLTDYITSHMDTAADYFETLLEWRKWTKIRSWGYDKYVNPVTGLIHPKWNQVLPITGRLSCSDPNLQNVDSGRDSDKPNMRKLFPAREGHFLTVADWGQQEPRILAQISGDQKLIIAANGSDIYTEMAKIIYNREDIVKEDKERQLAKIVVLALSYGAGPPTIAKSAGVSLQDAENAYNKFKKTFSSAVNWGDRQIFKVKRIGFAETMMGRRLWFQELDKYENKELPFTHWARVARNMPIQGTGADMMKVAMYRINKELEERNIEAWIRLQVHDEVVVEGRLGLESVVEEIVERNMVEVMQEFCPDVKAVVDVSTGEGWVH